MWLKNVDNNEKYSWIKTKMDEIVDAGIADEDGYSTILFFFIPLKLL